jgi:hypothetical protein
MYPNQAANPVTAIFPLHQPLAACRISAAEQLLKLLFINCIEALTTVAVLP